MNLYNKMVYEVEVTIPWIMRTTGTSGAMVEFGVQNLFNSPSQAMGRIEAAVKALITVGKRIKNLQQLLFSLSDVGSFLDPSLFEEAYSALRDAINNAKAHAKKLRNKDGDGLKREAAALDKYVESIG